MTESKFAPRQTNDELFPYSGSEESQLRFMLKYAILAPSHYNAQPWKFRVVSGGVNIFKDTSRGSNIVDPKFRELTISCGSAVRMIEVACRYFANIPSVSLTAPNQAEYLARIELAHRYDPSAQDISLFHAIKQRQTNRGSLNDAVLPYTVVQSCNAFAKELGLSLLITREEKLKNKFASLTAMAVRKQLSMPWYRLEFSSWLRSKFSLKSDGVTGFGFFAKDLPLPITKTKMKWMNQGKQIGDFNRDKVVNGSPILAVISTQTDTQQSWINTGRMLSHLLLELTAVGLSASFMNQAIQEPELRGQVTDLFDCESCPQLILRVGTAKKVQWTPRMPVEDSLV